MAEDRTMEETKQATAKADPYGMTTKTATATADPLRG
jgi:hypothetical protein